MRLHQHRSDIGAKLLGLLALCFLFSMAVGARGQATTEAYDGTYIGMPTPDMQNKMPPCGLPASQVLDVKNGVARLRSVIDTRTGQVQPDGRLLMLGEQAYGSTRLKAQVEGRFSGNRFEGISKIPENNCVFHWVLIKS